MSQRSKHRKPSRQSAAISDEERTLFRDLVGPVETVRKTQRRRIERPLPSARPVMREADEAAVIDELLDDIPPDPDLGTGDDLWHRQDGIQHGVMRRLRRGHYRCQAEIDLHGMIVSVARECLAIFLRDCLEEGYSCIRIVHGKGLRSGHRGPVLKVKVAGWLRQRSEVLAYCSARQVDGGTGALYVLLKRR